MEMKIINNTENSKTAQNQSEKLMQQASPKFHHTFTTQNDTP